MDSGTKATNDIALTSFDPIDVKSLIYVVRNQQVILDSDLAMIYDVETKVFNQAVRRNENRFAERFRFRLTSEEEEGAILVIRNTDFSASLSLTKRHLILFCPTIQFDCLSY